MLKHKPICGFIIRLYYAEVAAQNVVSSFSDCFEHVSHTSLSTHREQLTLKLQEPIGKRVRYELFNDIIVLHWFVPSSYADIRCMFIKTR